MAERRMFAKSIVTSDAFLDMPMSSRCLYFTLGMLADDDGFVNNPKSIMRQVGATNDDFQVLLAKKFIIAFESGVIVIKHWRLNNYLRSDRYSATKYIDEKASLDVDTDGIYHKRDIDGIPAVYQTATQDRLGKDRIGQDRLYKKENLKEKSRDNGGRKVEKIPPYIKDTLSIPYPYDTDTTDTDTVSISDTISIIISYMNEKLGTRYREKNKETRKHINARLKEGFTVEDFKKVIDKKCASWGGTDMEKYLRPETLFGTKFESYLNEKESKATSDRNELKRIASEYDALEG